MTNHENNGESTPGVLTGYWDKIKDRGPFGRIKKVFGKIAVVLAGTSLALGGAVGCSNETNSTEANSEVSASATATETNKQDASESPSSSISSTTPEIDTNKPDGLKNEDSYSKLSNGEQLAMNHYELFARSNEIFAEEGVDITDYGQYYYDENFELVGNPDIKPTPSQVAESIIARLNVVNKVAGGGKRIDKDIAGGLLNSFTSTERIEESLGPFYGQSSKTGDWSKPPEMVDAQDLVTTLGVESSDKTETGNISKLKFPITYEGVVRVSNQCIDQASVLAANYRIPSEFYELIVKVENSDGDTLFLQMILEKTGSLFTVKEDDKVFDYRNKVKEDPNTDPETIAKISDIPVGGADGRYLLAGVSVNTEGTESKLPLKFPGKGEEGLNTFPKDSPLNPPTE